MSKVKELPTREYLLECFRYDRELGKIFWKERPRSHFNDNGNFVKFNKNIAGKEAYTIDKSAKGFVLAKLDKSVYKIHRLIWKLEYDEDCTDNLEHIDGDVKNNRITNLRKYIPAWESKKQILLDNIGNNRIKIDVVEENKHETLELPTQEYLIECFEYNEEVRGFIWKERPLHHFCNERYMRVNNSKFKGKVAGSKSPSGYVKINMNSGNYSIHRLVWKWHYGTDLVNIIDHINGDKSDNRICNLRDVNRSENGVNQVNLRKDNITGYSGIHFCKHHKKYLVKMRIDKESKFIGYFKTLEEAIDARNLAATEYFGEFNPNK